MKEEKKYEISDYNAQEEIVEEMSKKELADYIRGIARGWIPDYNFTGDESDFENYKLHMIMERAATIIEKETK